MINIGLHISKPGSSLHLGGCPSWCGKRIASGVAEISPIVEL